LQLAWLLHQHQLLLLHPIIAQKIDNLRQWIALPMLQILDILDSDTVSSVR
jgi:hypothetical protein